MINNSKLKRLILNIEGVNKESNLLKGESNKVNSIVLETKLKGIPHVAKELGVGINVFKMWLKQANITYEGKN